jgi:hypothetical protein
MRTGKWALSMWVVLACSGGEYEGDEPGECDDDADNDRDLLYDCLDPDCAGAAVCNEDNPTPSVDTDDTDVVIVDTEVTTTDGRPPGPLASETDLISIWEQLEETVNTRFGPGCFGITSSDWEDVFAAPSYAGEYVYVFFRLQSGQTTAVGQDCSRGFPEGCVDNDVVYLIDDHVLTGALEDQDIFVDNVPGCTISIETTAVIEDNGETGQLTFEISLSTTPACPGELQINNSCDFFHEYDLDWNRAE